MMHELPILVRIARRVTRNIIFDDNRLLLGYGDIAAVQFQGGKLSSADRFFSKFLLPLKIPSVLPSAFSTLFVRGRYIDANTPYDAQDFIHFRIPHLHTISSADLTGDALFKPPSLFAFKPLSWSGLTLAVPTTRYDGWRESGLLDDWTVSDNNVP